MHKSVPPDSLLATRLASGYYTTALPRDKFTGVKPSEPNNLDQAEWDAHYEACAAHKAAYNTWKLAGAANHNAACEKHLEDRHDDFRVDLIAAVGLTGHPLATRVVEDAEEIAEEWADRYEQTCDYEFCETTEGAELEYAVGIAARFAALLKA